MKITKQEGDGVSLPLAITCGDPAGIGPEVIARALREDSEHGSDCVLLGPASWVEPLAAELGIAYETVGPVDYEIIAGEPSVKVRRWQLRRCKLPRAVVLLVASVRSFLGQ